jgi:hypothetical protein
MIRKCDGCGELFAPRFGCQYECDSCEARAIAAENEVLDRLEDGAMARAEFEAQAEEMKEAA